MNRVQHRTPESSRPRVLLVEDNYVIGLVTKQHLEQMGYDVVGPVASLGEALHRSKTETFAGAILDVNIRGGTSELVARELLARGCPFFFVTGYASPMLISEQLRQKLRLGKPVTEDVLRDAVNRQFGPGQGG